MLIGYQIRVGGATRGIVGLVVALAASTLPAASTVADLGILTSHAARASSLAHDYCQPRFTGGPGDDKLIGNENDNHLCGRDGSDWLVGRGGDDALDGGRNGDILHAGPGPDGIQGDEGPDTVHGGRGPDGITGGSHADDIYGGEGNDTVSAAGGDDRVYGGAGNDSLEGKKGADIIRGGPGDDYIKLRLAARDDVDRAICGAGTDEVYMDGPDKAAADCEVVTTDH